MNAQRAAEPADLHERVEQLGPGGQQLPELVDDDDEVGQGLGRRTGGGAAIGVDGRVTCAAEQLLPPFQLAGQGGLHPVDQAEVVDQVRDQPDGVRKGRQLGERGATLEVDQQRVEHRRWVPGRQSRDERSEQLGLARAGRPHQDPVRSVAAGRCLVDVEDERFRVVGTTDRDAGEVADVAAAGRALVEQGEQAYGTAGQRSALAAGDPPRSQPPGQRLGVSHVDLVGDDPRDGRGVDP